MLNSIANPSLQSAFTPVIFYAFLIWSIVWKGIALWKSSRNKQLYWFLAILVLNSVGVVEIIYVLFFQMDKNDPNWRNNTKPKNKIIKKLNKILPLNFLDGVKNPLKLKKK